MHVIMQLFIVSFSVLFKNPSREWMRQNRQRSSLMKRSTPPHIDRMFTLNTRHMTRPMISSGICAIQVFINYLYIIHLLMWLASFKQLKPCILYSILHWPRLLVAVYDYSKLFLFVAPLCLLFKAIGAIAVLRSLLLLLIIIIWLRRRQLWLQ